MPIVVAPEPEIWQGDIFADVPWSVVRAHDFVQPTRDNQRYVAVAPPPAGGRGRLVTHGGRGLAMLLSHECVVDKRGRAPLAFARVLPITSYDARGQEYIRRGQNYQTFHLPGVDALLAESYADFRIIVAIDP